MNFGAYKQVEQMEGEGVTAGNNKLGCTSAGTESDSEEKSLLSQLRHAREVCHKGVVRYTTDLIRNVYKHRYKSMGTHLTVKQIFKIIFYVGVLTM